MKKIPTTIFLLTGDFNLPSASFQNAENHLNNKLSYFNFMQLNTISNNVNSRILDYVISNSNNIIINRVIHHIVKEDNFDPSIDIYYKDVTINYYLKTKEYICK